MENSLIGNSDNSDTNENTTIALKRAGIAGGGILTCLSLAQIGGFGTIANLVGGVAQGSLAFILPPLIAITISRSQKNEIKSSGVPVQFTLDQRAGKYHK